MTAWVVTETGPVPLVLVAALCCYFAGAASFGAYITHVLAGERPKRFVIIAVAFLLAAGICLWLAWE